MSSWVLGAGLAVALSVLSAAYFWLIRRPEQETTAGLHALAGLRWREVSSLIRQAMQRRGLRDTERAGGHEPGDDSSRLLMTDGDARVLLVCKHGMAYRIGMPAIEELVAAMDLAGARRGILLTQGRAEREAHGIAQRNAIEIIDGRQLWPLLKPHMADATRAGIVGASRRQAMRHSAIAALGALTLGLVVALALPALDPRPGSAASPSSTSPLPATSAAAEAPVQVPAPVEPAAPVATPPGELADDGTVIQSDPDEATEQRYQADIKRQIDALPGIERSYWLTRATLVIDRTAAEEQIWPLICARLERYPSLRTIRVQLNPRPEHQEAVRWRQCRTI